MSSLMHRLVRGRAIIIPALFVLMTILELIGMLVAVMSVLLVVVGDARVGLAVRLAGLSADALLFDEYFIKVILVIFIVFVVSIP